jgi:hypothetical protein
MTIKLTTARCAQIAATAIAAISMSITMSATAAGTPSWDIGKYDKCLSQQGTAYPGTATNAPWIIMQNCCAESGGVWKGDGAAGNCYAPPAERSPGGPPTSTKSVPGVPAAQVPARG